MTSLPRVLGGFIAAMVGLVVAATVAFMMAEDLTPVQALYFAVVTITTVGYGDISPKTGLGMILCVVMILGGVCIFSGGVGLIANGIISKRDRDAAEAKTHLLLQLFVSTIGLGLLERFTASNLQAEKLQTKMNRYDLSSQSGLKQAKQDLVPNDFVIDLETLDPNEWRTFLHSNSQVFLVLLSNPAVSEGLRVTSVLRRTYNLELVLRVITDGAPTDVADELRRELESIYHDLTLLWLDYLTVMLKESPYAADKLVSLNPFRSTAS